MIKIKYGSINPRGFEFFQKPGAKAGFGKSFHSKSRGDFDMPSVFSIPVPIYLFLNTCS